MKKLVGFILLLTITSSCFSQAWTSTQINTANTASKITYLSSEEKEAIKFINLARLYPNLFVKNELAKYVGVLAYGDYIKNSTYKKSLIAYLNKMTPVNALVFDEELYENAKCFAEESGIKGKVGHVRDKCPKKNYAECCSYGMEKGKDIAMQLLIDHDVPSLGHRLACLSDDYSKVGLSVHAHKRWGTCAVVEIIW